MKPGSVIFDLAVVQGGNVEGSVPDKIVEKHGVIIMGYSQYTRAFGGGYERVVQPQSVQLPIRLLG